jgi:hypothetical protein
MRWAPLRRVMVETYGSLVRRGRPATRSRSDEALSLLRLSMGVIWGGNLLFILLPANQFFPTFAATATGMARTTLGGPGLASFVSSNAVLFSAAIALATGYLALAFLLGVTTRVACVVGSAFSLGLLIAQWGATFSIPGGTDVGPHPIYLVAYLALAWSDSARFYSLPALLARWRLWSGRIGLRGLPSSHLARDGLPKP